MDRAAFEHLYLHANCLAELAFARSMLRMMSAPPVEPTPEEMAKFEQGFKDLAEMKPEDFDWSIYAPDPNAPPPPPPPAGPGLGELVALTEDEAGAPDVASYFERAQAVLPDLQPRIDDCFGRVDHAALESFLAAVPGPVAPITGPLTPAQFEQWLALYEARSETDESPVGELVLTIRALEPML